MKYTNIQVDITEDELIKVREVLMINQENSNNYKTTSPEKLPEYVTYILIGIFLVAVIVLLIVVVMLLTKILRVLKGSRSYQTLPPRTRTAPNLAANNST